MLNTNETEFTTTRGGWMADMHEQISAKNHSLQVHVTVK